MARVLVSHSYFYFLDPKQWKAAMPYPPLGTLYAAAVLREEGHEVHFFDNGLQQSTSAFKAYFDEVDPEILLLCDDGFNYLTKMCLTAMREAAFDMIKWAKQKGAKVMVSSSDATDQKALYLKKGADFVIIGEVENTIREVFSKSDVLTDRSELPQGLAHLNNGEVELSGSRPPMRDLDELPMPAWDLVDVQTYRDIWMKNHGYFSINISTTRGCPFRCNWCAKPIYGNRYNSHSPGQVAKEMDKLIREHQVDHFWICDDIFGLKPNWVQEFSSHIEILGIKPRYKIQSRVDLLLKDDTVEALIKSGMEEVWVGAESGSQKILDAMDKGITIEQIRTATQKVKGLGGRIGFFLQFGYPGEETIDIHKTIKLLLDLMPDDIGVSVSYPLPGTPFYERVKEDLQMKANWTDSDDLDLMFQGTHSRKFYRRLHRFVHRLYRRKQGIGLIRKRWSDGARLSSREWRSVILAMLYYTPFVLVQRMFEKRFQLSS